MCKERLKQFSRVEKEVACERGVCMGVGTKERPRANRLSSMFVGAYFVLKTVTPPLDSQDEGWATGSLGSSLTVGP